MNRTTLTLNKPRAIGAPTKPKSEKTNTPYSHLIRLVGQSVKIRLSDGTLLQTRMRKVHTYEIELEDGKIIPKHATLLIEPI